MTKRSGQSRGPYLLRDRKEAGERLAEKVSVLFPENPLVLALPRGGVPVALEIARTLGAPLDLVLVRKLGTSWQPELALGAVMGESHHHTVVNEDVANTMGVSKADIARIAKVQFQELEHRRRLWLDGRDRTPATGHTAIVVDDGVATGATMRVALEAVRRENPIRLILASPVAPEEVAEALRPLCDDAVFLATPRRFASVGDFYQDFRQLHDNDIKRLIQSLPGHERWRSMV